MTPEKALAQSSFGELMSKLAAFEPVGFPFISLYLNTQPDTTGRDSYKIWLKNELSERAKEYGNGTEEGQSFNADAERITDFLNEIRPDSNGVAVFASFGADFFETAQFTAPINENEFFASDRPHIFPMARLVAQNPPFAVVFADSNKADIYVFGGKTVDAEAATEAQVEEIQNANTNHHKAGGWSQMRFQRSIENDRMHHAKEVVAALDKIVRDESIEKIVLSGDETGIIPTLREQMPKELTDKTSGVLSLNQYAAEKELYEAALAALDEQDAVDDQERVGKLMDEVGANNLGVTGVAKTLAALSNGQVEELLINTLPDSITYNEGNVHKVLRDYAPGDDNSVTEALPEVHETRQVLDEIIARALNSAARIRFVEDDTLLAEVGGIGAILRYKI